MKAVFVHFGLRNCRGRWQSAAAGLSSEPRNAASSVGSGIALESSASPEVLLAQLDLKLRRPAETNADDMLNDLKALHTAKLVVPQTFYMDALRLVTSRKDAVRTELLLRMAQSNVFLSEGLDTSVIANGQANESRTFAQGGGNRSRPSQDSYHKLVSYAVTGLLREGCLDEAMTLLVRMSNEGYLTSRISLEKLLDSLGVNCRATGPSFIAFLDKIHKMVVDNRWDQAPRYYTRLLKVLRHHLLRSCQDKSTLDAMLQRLESFWSQAQSHNQGKITDVELLSIRAQCLIVAARAHRMISHPGSEEKAQQTMESARQVFQDAIQFHVSSVPYSSTSSTSHVDRIVFENVKHLVSSITIDDGLNELTSKDMFKITDSANPIKVDKEKLNYAWNQTLGQFRSAFASLVTELAQDAHVDDALSLLTLLLQQAHQQQESPSVVSSSSSSSVTKAAGNSVSNLESLLMEKLASTGGSKRLKAVPAAGIGSNPALKRKQNDGDDWTQQLVAKIFVASARNLSREKPGGNFQNSLTELATKLKSFSLANDIPVKDIFYAAWIESLYPPLVESGFNDAATTKNSLVTPLRPRLGWEKAYQIAMRLIDSLEDEVGRTPIIQHAVVSLLCRYLEPAAISQAESVLRETMTDGKNKVRSETFAFYIESSVACLGDEKLAQTLSLVEELVQRSDDVVARDPAVLVARLRAHARLCRGYKSLELLRNLRMRKSELNLGRGPERHVYTWVINALYLAWPSCDAEWRIATDPESTSEYILREMHRDGHSATSATIAMLLKLYTKACQIDRKKRGASLAIIDQAENFLLRSSQAGGNMGHSRVIVTDSCIREIVKACCLSGQEERAISTIDKASRDFGLKPNSVCWEPLIYYYASKQGSINTAEDVLTMMTNRQVKVSSAIADAFVTGHLKQGDSTEALDRIEDIFNQHGVRPTPATFLKLLDFSLQSKDAFEAKRVVSVMKQMYTNEERDNSLVWLSTTARAIGSKNASEARMKKLGQDAAVQLDQDDLRFQHADIYRLHNNGASVGPVLRGALSDEMLRRRFLEKKVEY